ncbi:MAG: MBL fold metallo-hydrolase, partial [Gammaproteobacteria bacterium]|nr:MBL fold metallo-hydrolase [Gammaproteobacteria bacterium]
WQVGYKTARQLNVKNLVLSGFNPDLSDDDLDKIALATKEMQGNTIVAVEGESLTL